MYYNEKLVTKLSGERLALTVEEAAEASCICRSLIYAALGSKKLVGKKVGRKTLILVRDLHDYLDKLPEWAREEQANA